MLNTKAFYGSGTHSEGLADSAAAAGASAPACACAAAAAAVPAKVCGLVRQNANGAGLAACGAPAGSGAGRPMARRDMRKKRPEAPVTMRSPPSRASSSHPWPAASSSRA